MSYATAELLVNFYVSHFGAARLLRNGEKCIYFVANSFLFLFPTVKEFSESVKNW